MIPLFKVLMSPEAGDAVKEVLYSGHVAQGPKVKEFEQKLSDYLNTDVLAVNSCTSALDLAMDLSEVKPNTEVITSPLNCLAGTCIIVNRGARPVWSDIDSRTGNIKLTDVINKLTPRTAAVQVVDWAGRSVDVKHLRELLDNAGYNHVMIIQDSAHSFLPINDDVDNHFQCWSFQAIKFLTCTDSGALKVPYIGNYYDHAKLARWFGLNRESSESFRCKQDAKISGYKYNQNDVMASIGLSNLELAKKAVKLHQLNAKYYNEQLQSCQNIHLPPPSDKSSWWIYPILVKFPEQVDLFIEFCKQRDVEVSPVHARNDKHTAFNYYNGPLPGVDYYTSRHIAIPVGWWINQSDREHIVNVVREWDKSL